ncbi:adenylate/guanylate cyclase domain-containing protein [Sinorhizobium numidicum]|uniref:Adenylate/guanylate cyclase domain-containing protein n=1 Tax=Sinorhizobium numidicum TaxID=680248 RepID=A0ABY8CXQ8_9HYPH|nr:adenylate/guanylate cyclase domain-containing protein [Sinorhizobium numidicum]WEX76223.1 adenylate/guanylate cyclase domain-containing protein [Sinorhizobium numidicum]WEX82882.1 adenylate/guanylate cyclase domain-containing protein [Sinorhizobium numidicum]
MSELHRKLTTIFCADVQDYSRLMGADEEGTLATLRLYRDAMGRLIEAHGGRVVNTWGDGLIAEFPSVVEAVRAAVDVQNELAGLNAERPSEARMLFRIGINLGDVIADGDDIYGDGVNIAARLQSSAPAGGIVISSTVYDQVRNKVAVGFEFLGQLQVKNIEEGVPSYAVRIGAAENAAMPTDRAAAWGRQGSSGERADAVAETRARSSGANGRPLAVLVVIAAGIVAINVLSWSGEFWAVWPLLALAVLAALRWIRTTTRIDRGLAALGVAGLIVVAVNLLSWHGEFWAAWPLLGLAIAAGLRWITLGRRSARH